MTTQDALPRYFIVCKDPNAAFWKMTMDWASNDYITQFLYFMAAEAQLTIKDESDYEDFKNRTTALVDDLIELRQQGFIDKYLCNLLQFYNCSQVLMYAGILKQDNDCFQWICNSIGDDLQENHYREFDFARLKEFLVDQDDKHQYIFWQVFPMWLTDLFAYARRAGSLHNLCRAVVDKLLPIIVKRANDKPSQELSLALAQISAWCSFYAAEKQEEVNKVMLSLYETSQHRNIEKIVAFQFAVGNKGVGGRSKREWSLLTLEKFRDMLRQHDHFQLLVSMCNGNLEKILEHLDEMKGAISDFVNSMEYPSSLSSNYHIGWTFSILSPVINTLVMNGCTAEANQLIGSYFSIHNDKLIGSNILYIIPNYVTGIKYCFYKHVITQDASTEAFKEMLRTRNRFLRIAMALRDDPEFLNDFPERYGQPDYNLGPALLQQLQAYFDFKRLLEYPDIQNCQGLCLLFDTHLPIQNILSQSLGKTLPLLRNFTAPLPARKMAKVFIWQGETFTTELARSGLEEIFGRAGIEVIFRVAAESTKDEFLHHFRSNDYDIFWILSHGEYEHFEPHASTIDLGNGISAGLDELKENNYQGDERRLLVMDMCNGATALMNNQASIGLGVSLTHAGQSMIGHSWPVENMPSLILGLLLGSYLAEGFTYEEAHHNTINIFIKGKQEVISRLSSFIDNDEIVERIRNVEFDFTNFCYWGILNYIQ